MGIINIDRLAEDINVVAHKLQVTQHFISEYVCFFCKGISMYYWVTFAP